MGAVSAVGVGTATLWDAMASGRGGLRPLGETYAPFADLVAGIVPGGAPTAEARCVEFAAQALREAWAQAALSGVAAHRIALVVGTSVGRDRVEPHRLANRLASMLGVGGPVLAVSTACTSSTAAIGIGRDLVLLGDADAALVGGVDDLTIEMLGGFRALGLVTDEPCSPFSLHVGTSLAEGAGFLVLERRSSAEVRQGVPLASLLGYALAGEAFNDTAPDPRGLGARRALRAALLHSRVSADEVRYVNAHGTGTAQNDAAEWTAIRAVLGSHAEHVPVSSTKGHLGHTQGAAGALETIATIVAMSHDHIPSTLNFVAPRKGAPSDPVPEPSARPHRFEVAVKASAAFGGSNAVLILARPERRGQPDDHRPVYVTATAQLDAGDMGRALPDADPAAIVDAILRAGSLRIDGRRLDPTAAVLANLTGRCVDSRRRGTAERVGVMLGATRVSKSSSDRYARSFDERGPERASTTSFSRLILNAPVGSVVQAFGLCGPQTALTVGPGSGLAAVGIAAETVASRTDVDGVLAAGVSEQLDRRDTAARIDCGGVMIALGSAPASSGPRVRVAGWAWAGTDAGAAALRAALDRVELVPTQPVFVFAPRTGPIEEALGAVAGLVEWSSRQEALDRFEAVMGMCDLIAAVETLRASGRGAAIVVSERGTASQAIVLQIEANAHGS